MSEDEHCVSQVKVGNAKLTEFMCERETLFKLVHYATRIPSDPQSHDISKKFPFVAHDILT